MKDATSFGACGLAMSTIFQAPGEPGDRDFRAADLLAELMQPGIVALRRAVLFVDLETGERHGTGFIGDIHEPKEGRRGWPGSRTTSSSRDQHHAAARRRNGTGRAVCVGQGNGGLQSNPETNFGWVMSSMSRMTKPPCQ